MQGNYGPSVLRGVFAHIAAAGEWGLEIVRTASAFTAATVRDAVRHKVDGFIIALNEEPQEAYSELARSKIPFATVETYSRILDGRGADASHVRIDNLSIGRDAALGFLAQGRYDSFGFVGPRSIREWSRLRETGFRKELVRHNRSLETFASNDGADPVSRRGDLAKWLRKLPKPAAILAADDPTALDVLQACQAAKLGVPGDVAVLGVDDEALICENSTPTLSSIRPDFVGAGLKAAGLLDRMMRRHGMPSQTHIVKGSNEIVFRQSTSRESSSGPLVQKALAFIANNARRGIGVKDVQDHLRVSRSLMDLRFRQVRGESVLSVILRARLKELKRMLKESDRPIGEITAQLGWASPNYPKNLFRRTFGMSMRDWRTRA